MGKISDYVMARKIEGLSTEERKKLILKETERKMAEVREQLRQKEQTAEWEQTVNEVFANSPDELPTGAITGFLSADILKD